MAAFPMDYTHNLNLQDFLPSIQFFVRTISGSKTLVLRGNPQDRVHCMHQKIQSLTGIPVSEQRLIYGGKQLHSDQTLSECMITNDSGLHLVGRMRSCWHPEAWQVINDLVSVICRLCKGESGASTFLVKKRLIEFLSMIQISNADDYLHIFIFSCVPEALVMLYMSPDEHNKNCALESIGELIESIRSSLPRPVYSPFLPVVLLELCKALQRAAGYDDPLYKMCRGNLGKAMNFHNNMVIIASHDLFPFAAELASKLSRDLVSSMKSHSNSGPSINDVKDFMAFLKPLKAAVKNQVVYRPILPSNCKFTCEVSEIKFLYVLFDGLLTTLVMCLKTMEGLVIEKKKNGEWDQYLVILKELHDISKLYQGGEEYFWANLKDFKRSLCHLIVRYAKRGEDYGWILDQKDAINFESRRHLASPNMFLAKFRRLKKQYGGMCHTT